MGYNCFSTALAVYVVTERMLGLEEISGSRSVGGNEM